MAYPTTSKWKSLGIQDNSLFGEFYVTHNSSSLFSFVVSREVPSHNPLTAGQEVPSLLFSGQPNYVSELQIFMWK